MDESGKLQPNEARKLAEVATQTSFNWVVLFLAFIAGLVGLLEIARPYESNYGWGWWAFSIVVSITYLALTVGLSYSIYATMHTRFLILHLRRLYETPRVQSFLKENWSRLYTPLLVDRNNNFRERLAKFLSVCAGIVSILLLLFLFVVKF